MNISHTLASINYDFRTQSLICIKAWECKSMKTSIINIWNSEFDNFIRYFLESQGLPLSRYSLKSERFQAKIHQILRVLPGKIYVSSTFLDMINHGSFRYDLLEFEINMSIVSDRKILFWIGTSYGLIVECKLCLRNQDSTLVLWSGVFLWKGILICVIHRFIRVGLVNSD